MAHNLQAIVFKSGSVGQRAKVLPKRVRVRLDQGLELILLRDDLFEQIHDSYTDKPTHLGGRKPSLPLLLDLFAAMACEFSLNSKAAYIETNYFGGFGDQSAILWEKGVVVYGPETLKTDSMLQNASHDDRANWPINRVLRELGAKRKGKFDEFAGIGLDRIRDTEDP